MTQDKLRPEAATSSLIAMAKGAGSHPSVSGAFICFSQEELQAFAKLIRKDQIGIDAGICVSDIYEASEDYQQGATDCYAAIQRQII